MGAGSKVGIFDVDSRGQACIGRVFLKLESRTPVAARFFPGRVPLDPAAGCCRAGAQPLGPHAARVTPRGAGPRS
eukprot:9543823-Lingulodinium_polyedra.AAC.1